LPGVGPHAARVRSGAMRPGRLRTDGPRLRREIAAQHPRRGVEPRRSVKTLASEDAESRPGRCVTGWALASCRTATAVSSRRKLRLYRSICRGHFLLRRCAHGKRTRVPAMGGVIETGLIIQQENEKIPDQRTDFGNILCDDFEATNSAGENMRRLLGGDLWFGVPKPGV